MNDGQNQTTGAGNRLLLDRIASARRRLHDKLVNLDVESLDISEYNRRYLGSKIADLNNPLQLYGRLLYLSLKDSKIPPEDFVLVDYGGGSGLISLLASEMGIGTVIYDDIYDVSCSDIKHLSSALGLTLDHIVCGDVDDLISYLHRNSISINAITSYDVLEHIYDVESHFRKLGCLSNGKFRIVYASGANMANPRYVRSVKKMQIEAEYKNRAEEFGHKSRDSLDAYFDVRKQMISAYAPELDPEQVDQLAHSTRGLIQRDIEKAVDEFRQHGSITYHIDHPTNTCDPRTGNWCEHLITFEWLEEILRNDRFSFLIMPGRYNTGKSLLKNAAKLLLNAKIKVLGRLGMFLAPYYVVYVDVAEQNAARGKDCTILHPT